jgi:tripartite-type tricarboxylate transporter receptor subunit TctC
MRATTKEGRNAMKRARVPMLAALIFTLTSAPIVRAQDYPVRTVTIIVPFAVGGTTNSVARVLAPKLGQRLGKPFVIENRPGDGTVSAATALANATPDGHTLMQATSGTLAMNVTIYRKLPYDPAKDLASVALIYSMPVALVVNSSLPVHSVADLIKLAKERPLSYGSVGPGTFNHLTAELFSTAVGIKMTHLPYTGSAPAVNALVAGHIQVMFTDLAPSLQLIRRGKLRALGITTAERAALAPELPPLAEVGVPGFDAAAWSMLIAPAKTPKPILTRLNAEVNAIVNTAEVKQQLVNLGINPIGRGSLDELQAFVKAEVVRWAKVVQEAGLAGSE